MNHATAFAEPIAVGPRQHSFRKQESVNDNAAKHTLERALQTNRLRLTADERNHFGLMHLYGLGLPQDDQKALAYFEEAAKEDHADAMNTLGVMILEGCATARKPFAAFKLFSDSESKGNINAKYNLGVMYAYGDIGPIDLPRAFDWYLAAAEQGHPEAQAVLGVMLVRGEGVTPDLDAAFKWFSAAAMQGVPQSQFNLGLLYGKGVKGAPDFEAAAYCMAAASFRGHPAAQRTLADSYLEGVGVKQDVITAFSLYQVAANGGDASAYFNLALARDYGIYRQQDDKEAFDLYLSAAKRGHTLAQFFLGIMYLDQRGIPPSPQNPGWAAYCFAAAAYQGDDLAQCYLADAYARGVGIPRNELQALYWYQKAAEQGHPVIVGIYQTFLQNIDTKRYDRIRSIYYRVIDEESFLLPRLVPDNIGIIDARERIEFLDAYFLETDSVTARTADGMLNKEKFESINERLLAAVFERADEITSASKGGRPTEGYEPRKESRIRLEPVNIEWLKAKGPNHLSRINGLLTALREAEEGELQNLEK